LDSRRSRLDPSADWSESAKGVVKKHRITDNEGVPGVRLCVSRRNLGRCRCTGRPVTARSCPTKRLGRSSRQEKSHPKHGHGAAVRRYAGDLGFVRNSNRADFKSYQRLMTKPDRCDARSILQMQAGPRIVCGSDVAPFTEEQFNGGGHSRRAANAAIEWRQRTPACPQSAGASSRATPQLATV
jgi:hypothetical protein